MAMFGWEDANMARVYTRKAAQKKMALSGAAKVSQINQCPTDRPTDKKYEENQHAKMIVALPTGTIFDCGRPRRVMTTQAG